MSDQLRERDIYAIEWCGPISWEQALAEENIGKLLYCIYGNHPVYGGSTLLCIGMTIGTLGAKMRDHKRWVGYESASFEVRYGKVYDFTCWDCFLPEKNDVGCALLLDETEAPEEFERILLDIESLLIFAHQPAYNSESLKTFRNPDIRLFNFRNVGKLLPEVGGRYYHNGPLRVEE
ncbi:hypothetical protein KKF84_21970 [Myxococcota bacterium]|nr:hypothetical protein [Myxococcota bacterium]